MKNSGSTRGLPVIKLVGHPFYADGRLDELRDVKSPWNSIRMADITSEGGTKGVLFNKLTKNLYEGELENGKTPKHVVRIIIPMMKDLDPVGVARRFGEPDNTYKKGKPIKKIEPVKEKGNGGLTL